MDYKSNWFPQSRKQGRIEGRAEGQAEGIKATLLKLLHIKFGSVPVWVKDRIDTAETPMLDRWTEQILAAQSIDDLFAT